MTYTNLAGEGSRVDIQASVVHGGVHYYRGELSDDPAENYENGTRLLDGDMPTEARKYFWEAVKGGHRTAEVGFHWLLACLSGKRRHDLSKADIAARRAVAKMCDLRDSGEWTDALNLLLLLWDRTQVPDAELNVVLKEFDRLGEVQRALMLRHLKQFLDGALRDSLWVRARDWAEKGQKARERTDRVWMYFVPPPIPPRARPVKPPAADDRFLTMAATAVFAAGVAYIGLLVLRGFDLAGIAAYFAGLLGGFLAAHHGVEWRFRVLRMRQKERELLEPKPSASSAPPGGFAGKIDRKFKHYFSRRRPDDVDVQAWLKETAGIRKALRDEMVEVYREQQVKAESIEWLIRFRAEEVKTRWLSGTLFDHRNRLKTPERVVLACAVGVTALWIGGLWAIVSALFIDPRSGIIATIVVAGSGWVAVKGWLAVEVGQRRYKEEQEEARQRLLTAEAEYERWKAKLKQRPTDSEMAAWLNCDRTLLLDRALRHYKLTPSEVIAHALLEVPASSRKRARVRNGPWRYSVYGLVLFLLTGDGVRQMTAELDFKKIHCRVRERTTYRFDAIASVQVTDPSDPQGTFKLTLVNGTSITTKVKEPEVRFDDADNAARATLDASGLARTLHVLEGIAAEGRRWIELENRRGGQQATTAAD